MTDIRIESSTGSKGTILATNRISLTTCDSVRIVSALSYSHAHTVAISLVFALHCVLAHTLGRVDRHVRTDRIAYRGNRCNQMMVKQGVRNPPATHTLLITLRPAVGDACSCTVQPGPSGKGHRHAMVSGVSQCAAADFTMVASPGMADPILTDTPHLGSPARGRECASEPFAYRAHAGE